MQNPDPVSVTRNFVAAVNRHEIEDIMEFLTDEAAVSFHPALPGTSMESYQGKGRIHDLMQRLFEDSTSIDTRNVKASGNEVTWESRISSDRFDEMGADPVQAKGKAKIEGSQISSFSLDLTPESVQKLQKATAAG